MGDRFVEIGNFFITYDRICSIAEDDEVNFLNRAVGMSCLCIKSFEKTLLL